MNIIYHINDVNAKLTGVDKPTYEITQEVTSAIQVLNDYKCIGMVPSKWVEYLENAINTHLDSHTFWDYVCKLPDVLSVEFNSRFFPGNQKVEGKARDVWDESVKKTMESNYPDFSKESKKKSGILYSHINNDKRVPLFKNKPNPPLEQTMTSMLNALVTIDNKRLIDKFLYRLLTKYETCHYSFTQKDVIHQIDVILSEDSDRRNLLVHAIFYSMYILSSEERYTLKTHISSRTVFSLSNIGKITWLKKLNSLPIDRNPLIVNCQFDSSFTYRAPMYLSGQRDLVDVKTFRQRVDQVTNNCFDGLNEYGVYLTGSTMPECVANEPYSDVFTFSEKDKLFYGGGDIDIAIVNTDVKEYMKKADNIIKLMTKNLGPEIVVDYVSSSSGIKYSVTHPKMNKKIDIFRVLKPIEVIVSTFHTSAVRMFYSFSSNEVFILRSCLAALLTGICDKFHWFSCNKIPAEIVLKYMQRGYTTILNNKELDVLIEYTNGSVKIDGEWAYEFGDPSYVTGVFDHNHKFFRIDKHPLGLRAKQPKLEIENTSNDNVHDEPTHATVSTTVSKYKESELIKFTNDQLIWYLNTPWSVVI